MTVPAPEITPGRAAPSIRPDPDPTVATQQQIDRALGGIRELIDSQAEIIKTRIEGDERAAELRLQTIDRVPATIDEKLSHVKELDTVKTNYERQISDIRFNFMAQLQNVADDLRATALIAAFAAQKESAAVALTTTTAALASLQTLVQTSLNGLNDKVDDIKDRIAKVESIKQGASESRAGINSNVALAGAVLGILLAVAGVVAGRGGL